MTFQAVSDVEITGPSRQHPPRPRSSAVQAAHQVPSMEPSSQVQPVQDQTAMAAVASPLVDDEMKEQIISKVKTCFRCVFFANSPFLPQLRANNLCQDSVCDAMDTILRGKLRSMFSLLPLICSTNRFSISINWQHLWKENTRIDHLKYGLNSFVIQNCCTVARSIGLHSETHHDSSIVIKCAWNC